MSNENTSTNKPPSQRRSRRFCIITYLSKDNLYRFLYNAQWVQHWAYIEHDRDKKEDGTIKEKHIHLLLYTYEAKTSSAILKRFQYVAENCKGDGESQNTMVQYLNDETAQFRYLMHLDNPDKERYTFNEITMDNVEYWEKMLRSFGLTDSTNNKGLQMFNDIRNGATTLEMIERYGKEYIYHAKQFKDAYYSYHKETIDNRKIHEYTLSHYFQVVLENDSTFDKEMIDKFWVVFNYIESIALTEDNSILLWYAIDYKTRKDIKENERISNRSKEFYKQG